MVGTRQVMAVGALALTSMLMVSACTATVSDDSATTTPTPSVECTAGSADQPTVISRLTLDGVSADMFATTMTVPFNGLEGGPLDRPSVVRAAVTTAEFDAPVTFRVDTGFVIADLGADWWNADRAITVPSTLDETGCSAAVYIVSTTVGVLTITAESQGVLTTSIDVMTSPAAARNVSMKVDPIQAESGESFDVSVTATDAFGNPVAGSTLIIGVPREAPARYLNGSNRATVLTDGDGTASVQLFTNNSRARTFDIRARGVDPRCGDVNQYGCDADEPFTGAPPAVSDVRQQVTVLPPPADPVISFAGEPVINPRNERR